MGNLAKLKASILEDGVIDADEVKALEAELYADGVIDREEADLLFDLNDEVSGNDNDPAWQAFFVKAISDYLLEDENSPGELDAEEEEWLYNKIASDGVIDGTERALLLNLKEKAKVFPDSLVSLL